MRGEKKDALQQKGAAVKAKNAFIESANKSMTVFTNNFGDVTRLIDKGINTALEKYNQGFFESHLQRLGTFQPAPDNKPRVASFRPNVLRDRLLKSNFTST